MLIYVFDVESREFNTDLQFYSSVIDALKTYSKDAKIFCLIHKMDLIQSEQRERVVGERQQELVNLSLPFQITTFSTSIWVLSLC